MGLLDDWSDGWLGLLRNATPSPRWNGGTGVDAANYPPPQLRQPQRLPLSFAGPDLAAGLPDWTQAQTSAASPSAAFPEGLRAASSIQTAPAAEQPLASTTQNLTAHALRTKGVPETNIAAAIGNPELMRQLISQNFGPSSNGTPRVPISGVAARPAYSESPLEDTPVHLAQVLAFPPISFFARPPVYIPRQLTPLENLPKGSANGLRAGKNFLRNEGKPKTPEEYPPCTYCGEKTSPGNFHRDHIIPRSRGGDGAESNRAPACADCNIHKGARTPEEWHLWMENNRT